MSNATLSPVPSQSPPAEFGISIVHRDGTTGIRPERYPDRPTADRAARRILSTYRKHGVQGVQVIRTDLTPAHVINAPAGVTEDTAAALFYGRLCARQRTPRSAERWTIRYTVTGNVPVRSITGRILWSDSIRRNFRGRGAAERSVADQPDGSELTITRDVIPS